MTFIPVHLYHWVYLLIVVVLSVFVFAKYRLSDINERGHNNQSEDFAGWIICAIMIGLIGTRPISPFFVDMTQYYGIYSRMAGEPFVFDRDATSLLYDNLMYYLASIRFQPVYFYILIAAIYFGCSYLACRLLFPDDRVASFVFFLAAFSTFSFGTNGIKAGSAASIFLLSLALRNRISFSILLSLISIGFHHSMILPVIAYFCSIIYHKPRVFFLFWVFCIIMAAAHVTSFQYFFARFSDEHGAGYLTATDGFYTGFRLDFILYSAMPVLLGMYSIRKNLISSRIYEILLSTYLLTNGIWMLCMYASYTNRIAYLSWLLYPFVLLYPLLHGNWPLCSGRYFRAVAYLHLGFTLFMNIVQN